MKRELHKLLAMILALVLSLAIIPVGSVDAASETTYGGVDYAPVYNCDFYMGYADLKNAFGSNRAKYLEHFVNNGMKEGRQASPDFNVTIYKENYEDLRKAFGNNLKSYYLHYINHGKSEGRNAVTLLSGGGTTNITPMPAPLPEKPVTTSPSKATTGNNQHIGEYKIVINYNGIEPNTVEQWLPIGTKYSLPAPTRQGYKFNYWKSGNKTYSAGYVFNVSSSMTFTASWTCTCQHPFAAVLSITEKAATCTKTGITVKKCMFCNTEISRTVTKALGHDYRICDENGKVTVKCSRCNTVPTVRKLEEFARYYNGQNRDYYSYTASEQKTIAAYWIRYNNPGFPIDQKTALKLAEHQIKTGNSVSIFSNVTDYERAAEYVQCLEKLSRRWYETETDYIIFTHYKKITPFEELNEVSGAILGNGFSGYINGKKDIRDSQEYTVLSKVLEKLSDLDPTKRVEYLTKVIDQYAKVTNKALGILYNGSAPVRKLEIENCCQKATTFKILVDNLDYFYSRCVGEPYCRFGEKYNTQALMHYGFIEYVYYRAKQEYIEIFGEDALGVKGY